MSENDKQFLINNSFLLGFFLGMVTGMVEFAIVFGYMMR